jgi:L-fucose mutarotase/ribose pyranase (RbsD/FucU family)
MMTMRNTLLTLALLAVSLPACAADWVAKVRDTIPLMGHRNWILIVDSAYPLQTAPGIETIETDASQLEVVRGVLAAIDHSAHVRPTVFMDAELPFVAEEDAPGVGEYRNYVNQLLQDYPPEHLAHEKLISTVNDAGKMFNVLILKTNMAIPYTSVFIRLDCKYWTDEQESRLRKKMGETKK